jgi:cell division protein ZapE
MIPVSKKETYIDFSKISFNVSIEECFSNLKPHPKFAGCTFDNYIPDDNFPSQHYIKNMLKETAEKMSKKYEAPAKRIFSFFKPKNTFEKPLNIYIDGSYGIGKTHLLSSVYNMSGLNKAFMSFSEMNYFFHYLGVEKCVQEFSKLDLLLVDEFELDDPAMCLIMVRFFKEVNKDTLIVTTSNTLPSELGKLRFQVERFQKEMGVIADSFNTIVVEGEDYRKKQKIWKKNSSDKSFYDSFAEYQCENKPKTKVDFGKMMKVLSDNHPFRYFVIPAGCEAIFIDGLEPFKDLNSALRFNHLIDHCYYYNTKLFIKSKHDIREIFSPEMIESPFQKKLLRCLSRLDELSVFHTD